MSARERNGVTTSFSLRRRTSGRRARILFSVRAWWCAQSAWESTFDWAPPAQPHASFAKRWMLHVFGLNACQTALRSISAWESPVRTATCLAVGFPTTHSVGARPRRWWMHGGGSFLREMWRDRSEGRGQLPHAQASSNHLPPRANGLEISWIRRCRSVGRKHDRRGSRGHRACCRSGQRERRALSIQSRNTGEPAGDDACAACCRGEIPAAPSRAYGPAVASGSHGETACRSLDEVVAERRHRER